MSTVRITDPDVYTAPWTIQIPLTAEPDYEMFEYACHEGNYSFRDPGTDPKGTDPIFFCHLAMPAA